MGVSGDATSRQLAGLADVGIEQIVVRILPDGRLTPANAAVYLGVAEKTLAMWAMTKRGPAWCKVGGKIFYYRKALDAFIRGEAA